MLVRNFRGIGSALDTVYGSPDPTSDAYSQAISDIAPNLPDVINQNGSSGQPWYVTAGQLVNTLLMTQQQRELLQIQADRAAKGLPPLDMSGYTGLGVNVGVSQGTQNMVIMLGAMIAGAALLSKIIGGRRGR